MRPWAILPAIAIAAVCGYLLGRASVSPKAPEQLPVPAAVAPAASASDVDLTRLQEASLKLQAAAERLEALTAILRSLPAAAPSANSHTTTEARPTAEAEAATTLANETLNIALGRHVWSAEDAQAFRRALPDLPPTERDRLVRKLLTAINSGQMQVTVRGAPF
ncbi:MAG: hypothetical protein ACJ8J7_13235 [Sulfurifustaceae bacterium]